jgi:ribose transport system permease protein
MTAISMPISRGWNWQTAARQHQGLILSIVVFATIFGSLNLIMPKPFGYYNFSTTHSSAATLALAGMGQALPVMLGGLDLSAGAVISLVNVLVVSGMHDSGASQITWTCLGLLAGGGVGAVNGFFIAYLRLQPIVVTLATMFIVQGVTLSIMKQPGGAVPADFSSFFVGDVIPDLVPAPLAILVGAILIWNLIRKTRFATALYAVGSDEEAARASGIAVRRVKFLTYVLAGVFYAAGGVFLTAQTGSGDPLVGPPMLLPIFVAVVLGGTPFGGGRGGCVGAVFGALTLMLTVNVLLVLNVSTYYSTVAEGILLILAVLGSSLNRESPLWRNLRYLSDKIKSLRSHAGPNMSPINRPRVSLAPAASKVRIDSELPTGRWGAWTVRNAETLRFVLPSYVALIFILAITGVVFRNQMSVFDYMNSLPMLASFLAVLALGQGAVILSGGLDMSVPWTITLAGIVLTGVTGGSNEIALWALPFVLLLGAGIGFLNGVGIVVLGISPIIVTLAMNGILQGAALVFSNGSPIGWSPPALRWLMTGRLFEVTPIVWFLAAFVIGASLLLSRTTFGRRLYATGNSQRVARFAGVPVGATLIGAYMLSGICSALVGILLSGFSGQAFLEMGDPYLLPSIAVVVVGGTLITGGRGHYIGMFGGALLLTALSTLLSASLISDAVRDIVYGGVVLIAVVALRERGPA